MALSVAAPAAAALLLLLCSLPAARPAAADGRAMQHMLSYLRQEIDAGVHKGQSYSASGCPARSLSCKTALATRNICDEPVPVPLLAGRGVLPLPGLALAGGIAGDVDPALAKYIRVPMHARPAGRLTADLAQSAFTQVKLAAALLTLRGIEVHSPAGTAALGKVLSVDVPLSGGDADAPFIAGLFSETAGSMSCESAAFYLTKAMASL